MQGQNEASVQIYRETVLYLSAHFLRGREAKRDANGQITFVQQITIDGIDMLDPKNLSLQEIPKLIIAQTVPSLRVCADAEGSYYTNNVRVNGIVAAPGEDLWFLLGILNAPVADFVFRRIAKPKDGGYFEANRQFIAPLPIPPATAEQRSAVAKAAKALQAAHTRRRDVLSFLARRLGSATARKRSEAWLFPTLVTKRDRLAEAPKSLTAAEAQVWAAEHYASDLAACYGRLGARLKPGVLLDAELRDGELMFLADGVAVADRIFVTGAEGPFLVAQWKVIASTFSVSERTNGKKLGDALRALAPPGNAGLVEQVISLQRDLAACEAEIKTREAEMNCMIAVLYALTPADQRLIADAPNRTKALQVHEGTDGLESATA
jgi:hypothetical protein